jgi:hypothetical protein
MRSAAGFRCTMISPVYFRTSLTEAKPAGWNAYAN